MLNISLLNNIQRNNIIQFPGKTINKPALTLKSQPSIDQVCFTGDKKDLYLGNDSRRDSFEIDKKKYEKLLKKLQLRMTLLQQEARKQNKEIILVFEGGDAAGKGGVIKRVTEKLDPRGFTVYPIGAPTQDEKNHHYLWMFWNKLKGKGGITIFDRSWYGRVLVERVEKFATEPEWKRAYREINEFERTLTDNGAIIMKFFLDISKDEQLVRFESRRDDPCKQHKLTDEDWRNRERWSDYKSAIKDMYNKTDTKDSHWNIIPSDSKRFARIETLKIISKELEKQLDIDTKSFYPKNLQ